MPEQLQPEQRNIREQLETEYVTPETSEMNRLNHNIEDRTSELDLEKKPVLDKDGHLIEKEVPVIEEHTGYPTAAPEGIELVKEIFSGKADINQMEKLDPNQMMEALNSILSEEGK